MDYSRDTKFLMPLLRTGADHTHWLSADCTEGVSLLPIRRKQRRSTAKSDGLKAQQHAGFGCWRQGIVDSRTPS